MDARFDGYAFTGPLRPHYPLSPTRVVLPGIARPDYADTGTPLLMAVADGTGCNDAESIANAGIPAEEKAVRGSNTIPIHTPEQIEMMRATCRVRRRLLARNSHVHNLMYYS